jgi:uncharacterized protein
MLVVSNTSPLLNLAIIRQLELLPQQFSEVIIPAQVLQELRVDQDLPGSKELAFALKQNWLSVRNLQDDKLFRVLAPDLDQGEAAAISLAVELQITEILMDENDGRAKAKSLGLQPIGVLGILLRAKRQGQIKSIRDLMEQLTAEAGFFIAPKLYAELLEVAKE